MTFIIDCYNSGNIEWYCALCIISGGAVCRYLGSSYRIVDLYAFVLGSSGRSCVSIFARILCILAGNLESTYCLYKHSSFI